jgi:hypothetical protein
MAFVMKGFMRLLGMAAAFPLAGCFFIEAPNEREWYEGAKEVTGEILTIYDENGNGKFDKPEAERFIEDLKVYAEKNGLKVAEDLSLREGVEIQVGEGFGPPVNEEGEKYVAWVKRSSRNIYRRAVDRIEVSDTVYFFTWKKFFPELAGPAKQPSR